MVKYDWNKIQEFYDAENSWREIAEHFGVSFRGIQLAVKRGDLVTSRTLTQAKQISLSKGRSIGNKPNAEFCQQLSESQSLHNRGGKSKWYEVSGQKVQGTWERDIATKFEELKIKWYKPKVGGDIWPYTIGDETRNYTPDFYLPDYNVYLEVKGHWWGNDKEKMLAVSQQHTNKRLVLVLKEQYDKIMGGEQVW